MPYIGFRIEIASRSVPHNLDKIVLTYNSISSCIIKDIKTNGKIAVSKSSGMVIASGDVDKRKLTKTSAMINFALLTTAPTEPKELERIIQIINVLGDGKLIRERVKTFVDGKSILNKIPELKILESELKRIEHYIPGFIINGWYYAPEAIF